MILTNKYIVFGDAHATPETDNLRADLLAKLIMDERPDVVVDLGDTADMSSLSSYDKGKGSFHGRSYKKDVESHNDFQKRVWEPVKARKKRMPHRIRLIGNHEQRINKVLDYSTELEGTIGLHDLELDKYYDVVVPYDGGTPGVIELDGILFAHYFVSGVAGRPLGGERPAHMLLDKTGVSCICGHSHLFDHACRINVNGRTRMGLVNGTFNPYIPPWAGTVGKLWRSGLSILHNVSEGSYDLEWVSLDRLEEMYR